MAVNSSYHWNHDFPKLARESGFVFNTHKPKVCIDWNNIKVIDIERVIRERDFLTIDEHIYEVLDCHLEVDFDVRILDSGFVKLFRLAQLAIEYLLQCRKYLDMAIPALQAETRQIAEDTDYLKRQLRSKEDEIRKLRTKTRKQQSNMGHFKNSDITNLLRYVTRNDTGDHNSGNIPFQKCPHCEKAFLNEFYLQSHLSRRHSNCLPNEMGDRNDDNQSPGHMVSHKFENERLLLEIKELKERLNNTEKKLYSNSVIDTSKDALDIVDKQTDHTLIVVSSPKKIDNRVIDNDAKDGIDINDKVEMDCMEKETLTVEVFEKWKNEEKLKHSKEIEALKKSLEESIESIKNKAKEKIDSEEGVERYRSVTEALKKQEEEVESLRKQLQEKTVPDFLDVSSRLEAQERFWRSKMEAADEENRKSMQDLQTKLLSHLEQAQNVQMMYRKRIDNLETSAKEQTRTLEDQVKKLSLMADLTRRELAEKEFQESQSGLIIGESHESLPPYEEGSLKSDTPKKSKNATIKSSATVPIMSNQRAKRLLKSKSINIEDESDSVSSSVSLQVEDKPPKINRKTEANDNIEKVNKLKEIAEKLTLSMVDVKKGRGKYTPKQLFNEADLSPPKNMKHKPTTPRDNMRFNKSNPDVSLKLPKSSIPHDQSSVGIKGKKTPLLVDKDEESSTGSDASSESDEGDTPDKSDSKIKMDSINRLSRKPSILEAVKNDLNLIVAKRLQQLGIRPTFKGITKEILRKNMATVRHRRHLVAKEHVNFNTIRKDIAIVVEDKIKGINASEKSPTTSKKSGNVRTSQSLNKIGSLLSNVKNKAMSVMRSRESVKSSDKIDKDYVVAKLKRDSKAAIFDEETYQAINRVINSNRNVRQPDKEASVDTSKYKNKTVIDTVARNMESTSEDGSSLSEDSDLDKVAISKKSDSKQFLVSAIAHTPSTSIENILTSPVRKPSQVRSGSNITEDSPDRMSPMKKIDAKAVSDVKSYNVVPKNGRMSKSEENLSSMYAGASSSSDESEDAINGDIRKSASEENVNGNGASASTKGVLKSVLSTGSLSKKKVLFDLDANQIKSLSASSSVSAAIEVQAKSQWDSRAAQDTDSDSDWNISNIEAEPINHNASVHYSSNETIQLSTKQSPKIAELSKTIGAQLRTRPEKPPVGGIETMFQAKSVQNSPQKPNPGNAYGGSTTSIASSIFDGNNLTATSNASSNVVLAQPVPRPRTVTQGRNKMLESDLELSDWSIEDLINEK